MSRSPHVVHHLHRVGGVFFLAARKPLAYVSFLSFTMWANLFHCLLMGVQAAMHMDRYWSKWFTDTPFVLILAWASIFGDRMSAKAPNQSLQPTGYPLRVHVFYD